jgi:UDPglucose 6-dehydrogenase
MKNQADIKIGIVGYGYVGKAMHNFLKNHYNVVIYDPALTLVNVKDDINQCDYVFVCVPTPSKDDGSCDTSIVEESVVWIKAPLIVIKSTVEVGTTKHLQQKYNKRIVFCPEYCGESTYWTPYKFHTEIKETPFFIFGGDKEDCQELINLYMPICGPVKTYRTTDSTSAELTKYIENSFYATKIAFCNEMYDVCKAVGTDWTEIRELWLLDPRLNPMHTLVFPNKRGFRGKCLPKDTKALVELADKLCVNLRVLKSVIKSNQDIINSTS